jgi:sulfite dehydrogenase (quinone) subunit SoeC
MHPALSVVFFTAISGSGFGLLLVLALLLLAAPEGLGRGEALLLLAGGALLASAGLLASVAHLGRPGRAWRALSQWRSSWLSREGVAALTTYLPIAALALLLWHGGPAPALRVAAGALALGAVATVHCTARIYTSLPPIPAWRHRLVLPGYHGFALLGGLLWIAALQALFGARPAAAPWAALVALLALTMLLLKHAYWRAIDHPPLPPALPAATGLAGAAAAMRPLEAPHTEANYLLREMGFVLARVHGRRLRTIVAVLLVLVALAAPAAVALPGIGGGWLLFALAGGQLAILVERWLFFAQARHLVTVYYGATGADARLRSGGNG